MSSITSTPEIRQAARHEVRSWRTLAWRSVQYTLLALWACVALLPFAWMLSTSLKARRNVFAYPPQWLPDPVVWQNYPELVQRLPFALFTYNSFQIAVLSVVGQLFFCSLAGYGFARFEFPLKRPFFGMLLATLMIPGIVNLIPQFIMYKYLGWLDTHLPLILPNVLASTFGTFLFRQFMLTIPQALEDAARIDGATPFGIYWRIMLPLCKPAAAVLATFTFIHSWNQLLGPIIFIQSLEKMTLTVGLSYFRTETLNDTPWQLLMAGATLTLLPSVLVFLLTQRYFVRGITMTGLKY
jgi:multiple sugar transport system permease protein